MRRKSLVKFAFGVRSCWTVGWSIVRDRFYNSLDLSCKSVYVERCLKILRMTDPRLMGVISQRWYHSDGLKATSTVVTMRYGQDCHEAC
ncbi:hypothetical protein C8J56DRAFT_961192 [Mycena floridula]|nr:hypothetical protein C8J56DRAFT_961192 [Mycena floridula]